MLPWMPLPRIASTQVRTKHLGRARLAPPLKSLRTTRSFSQRGRTYGFNAHVGLLWNAKPPGRFVNTKEDSTSQQFWRACRKAKQLKSVLRNPNLLRFGAECGLTEEDLKELRRENELKFN